MIDLAGNGAVNTAIHDSARNRPPHFGGASTRPDAAFLKDLTAQGMAPDDVGRRILDAIRTDEFHIFTRPSMRAPIEAWRRRIMAALDRAGGGPIPA